MLVKETYLSVPELLDMESSLLQFLRICDTSVKKEKPGLPEKSQPHYLCLSVGRLGVKITV
jgi:hypothetical protein